VKSRTINSNEDDNFLFDFQQMESEQLMTIFDKFSQKLGYIPEINEKQESIKVLARTLHYRKIEKRVNFFVVFIIFLDTLILLFESQTETVSSPIWVLVFS